jgi:hypothetical protein
MVTDVYRHESCSRASHPLWNRSLATPTLSSDGDIVREETASIAALEVPVDASVDVSEADWRKCERRGGGADRRAQLNLKQARNHSGSPMSIL